MRTRLADMVKWGYTPRWIVIMIDIFLAFVSIILSFLLRFNFKTPPLLNEIFERGIITTVSFYLISFIVVKSYKEIIRHTTFRSILKIFFAVLIATSALILLNFVVGSHKSFFPVPNSVLVINFFISFCMLGGSRVLIKQVFDTAVRLNAEPVVIYGAGNIGQEMLRNTLRDKIAKWKVIALADDDANRQGKNIAGVPVYAMRQVPKLIKKHGITRAIIAADKITREHRNEIATEFIQLGLQVSIYHTTEAKGSLIQRKLKDIRIEDLLERDPIQMNNIQINATLKGKRVLVTGAAGSIGSEMVKQLALFHPEIIILCDIAESPLHAIGLEMEENFSGVPYKLFIANIADTARMEYIFKSYTPDVVFHAAAYKHVPMMEEHPQEAIINNVIGTKVIADLSVQYGVGRFVMISTDKAVNPTNVMGASKRIAEMYIQGLNELAVSPLHNSDHNGKLYKTLFITTRFGNVLASNGSVIPHFKTQLEKGGPITVTHPDITRFFMTIPEACQLVLEAGVMGRGGEIFVFDMGKSIRIADLARNMITLAGLKPGEDIEIKYTGLRPGEKLFEEVLGNEEATLPTYHHKIKIARLQYTGFAVIHKAVNNLANAARNATDWDCVRAMKEIVPEFISNNSRFEDLDKNPKQTTTPPAEPVLVKMGDEINSLKIN